MTMRKIMAVTGSRAEYGLQAGLFKMMAETPDVDLRLVVTGSHLSEAQGMTVSEIEADGLDIAARIDLAQVGDHPVQVADAIARGVSGFAEAIDRLRPDLIVIFGDRFETLCPALAALPAGIPLAHIAGGQLSEGTMDDAIRHALSKMSHLHFTSTEVYGNRLVQLGEAPARVYVVGSLGLDEIVAGTRPDRRTFEKETGIPLDRPSLLVTFHPATLDPMPADRQMAELLAALAARPDLRVVFTMPNADPGNRALRRQIETFVADNAARTSAHESLGRRLYLAALSLVDGVVGNSSSGLIEAPSFQIGTVNIGSRQQGRIRPESVVDCPPERGAIGRAVERILSNEFRRSLEGLVNPFGDGRAAERILRILRQHPLDGLAVKRFHDVAFDAPGLAR